MSNCKEGTVWKKDGKFYLLCMSRNQWVAVDLQSFKSGFSQPAPDQAVMGMEYVGKFFMASVLDEN